MTNFVIGVRRGAAQVYDVLSTNTSVAKINKLAILGVRSFDNTRSENIQFSTPLTLIVGLNGSGKTTIIECLKYATTGDQPPNSKGGAFVHDPKLCNEKEVMAQVKLAFKSTTGAQMVVTRSLQVTVKKNTKTLKTLEGSLLMIKDGERTSISSRVAELDQIMPQYLGVSKAILDSVIFCHQDESMWPMSEPSNLKKRFDEIFEALKYTNAIENIKKLRKTYNDQLKDLRAQELIAKKDKDDGDEAERRSRQLSDQIENLKKEMEEFAANSKDAEEKWKDASNNYAKFEEVVASIKVKRDRQAWLRENVTDLRRDLKERTESDEFLQTEVNQYEQRMAAHEENKQKQVKQYEKIVRAVKEGREKLEMKHIEAGKYQGLKATHEQQILKRNKLIQESSRRHHIRGYEADLDDMQIGEYMDKISKLSKDQNAAVEKVRRETEQHMKKAQEVISRLGEQRSTLNESRNSAKQQSATNDRNLGSLQSQLSKIEIDEGAKAILDSKAEDLEEQLKKAKGESRGSSWDKQIQDRNVEVRGVEAKMEQLNQDVLQATNQAASRARLEYLKKELADRQGNLDKMMAVHNDRLRAVVSQQWRPPSLDVEFQKVIDKKMHKVREAEREREATSRGLEQVEFKLNNSKNELKKAEKDILACVKHLEDSIEGAPEDYHQAVADLQKERDVYKADVDNFENMRAYFTKGIAVAEQKHACNLCLRSFRGTEQADFIKKMKHKIVNDTAAQVEKDLKEAEDDLQKAKDAGPSYDTWVRLSKTELPRLQDEVKGFGAEREKFLSDMEERDKTVNEREGEKKDAESLARPITHIVQYSKDSSSFSAQIEEITLQQEDVGASRTLEAIQEEQKLLSEKAKRVRSEIEKFNGDKERSRSQISALELDLSKAKNKISDASYQLEKKDDIVKQIEKLRSENRGHRDNITRLDVQLQALAPQIAEEESKRDDIRERGLSKEGEMQQEALRLSENVHKLNLADQEIRTYLENGGPAKLDRCRREIETAQQEIQSYEDEQKRVTMSINKIDGELKNSEENKRTIVENIKYRRTLKDLESVDAEIAKLTAQNAEADQGQWRKEATYWEKQFRHFSNETTSKSSFARAKDDELAALVEKWETSYKDAAENFKRAHIAVETTKAAVEDLGRYGGAVDKAIMEYHSIKMAEINRIIEELWKKTYQGTDVDTVLIRSDNETARSNRSYNYRVVMVKQDAEMDMRGRCSAGQKVLACIIIRLALAECFGVNCGLIALDEPTTNLDHDNIRSLAMALHDIIETRRHQANFQLIVITHDEEFLKFMQCPDFADYYWRVSRNERQKSIIERQSIADVMA